MSLFDNASGLDLANFDPSASEFLTDPYKTFSACRHSRPAMSVGFDYKALWITRHEDIARALCEKDIWIKEDLVASGISGFVKSRVSKRLEKKVPKSLFASDNPRHDELRGDIAPLFMQSINDLDQQVEKLALSLLVDIKQKRSFDLIEEFAKPLTSRTLAHILGVPLNDWSQVTPLVDNIVKANNPKGGMRTSMTAVVSMRKLQKFYLGFIESPGRATKGQLIDLMRSFANDGNTSFTLGDVISNAVSISIAGSFSSTFVIGTGINNLLHNPDVMAGLREELAANAQSGILSATVNEMLRYDAPIQILDRFAAQDSELAGVRVAKGDKVSLVIGSANRDESVYSEPDKFDISRDCSSLMSFGDGIHRCLGAPVLNMVAPIAIRTLLTELTDFRLTAQPVWQIDPYFRGVTKMMLELDNT